MKYRVFSNIFRILFRKDSGFEKIRMLQNEEISGYKMVLISISS